MIESSTVDECYAAGRGPDNYPGKPFSSGGLPDTPEERERFEAYMRGHCWAVGEYDAKLGIYEEMTARCLYGLWRDRGAMPTIWTPQQPADVDNASSHPTP
jgi:hypothetical protein